MRDVNWGDEGGPCVEIASQKGRTPASRYPFKCKMEDRIIRRASGVGSILKTTLGKEKYLKRNPTKNMISMSGRTSEDRLAGNGRLSI